MHQLNSPKRLILSPVDDIKQRLTYAEYLLNVLTNAKTRDFN
jgi:hypothetical protein